MLTAVAYSAERLLLSPDWRDAIDDVLMHLGVAAGVSRAYLIQVDPPDTGYQATQLAEWCAPGVSSQFENPTLRGASLADAGFSRWIGLMSSRATVHGIVNTFPEEERVELTKQEIRSIAAFPVFADGEWWSFIGFDDCVEERAWTAFELDSLRAAAGMLGAAEQSGRAETRRRDAEIRYQRLVEQNPAVTYTESHHPEGGRFTFISPQLHELLGYSPDLPLGDRDWWWAHVHPEDRDEVQLANRISFSRGTDFDQTYRMRTADDTWAWVRDKVRPVRDEEGQILYWQGFLIGVTDRVETEERLREAEARSRAIVERIPAVTYTDHVGADGLTVMGFVSPQVEEILGYPPQRFLERADLWFEIMHPDDLARLRAIDAFNNADLEPFEHEYRMRHTDGHWVWVHDRSTAVLDEDGNLDYFLGFLTDVSSRHDAEARLREAELTFRTMVEQNPAVFYIQSIDPEDPTKSLTRYIGPRAEQLTGVPIEEMIADPGLWRTMVHPDDREIVYEADASSNTDGSDRFALEYRMVRRDGSTVWVLDEATLIRPENGAPYWQGFQLDITGRKEAEQRLQDAHEHLRVMVDSALDAVVSMDVNGVITAWNPQAETTFGWSADEVVGRPLVETIVPHAHRAAHGEGLRRWRETGEGPVLNARIEIQGLHRDGRLIPVELAIVPVAVGEETSFSGFIRDISERKRAQEDLERALEVEREAAARLRALDEMKDTFLQAVSHDLRTPLAAILGLAITLERGDVHLEAAESQDLARRIADNARRLDRLVTNLLDLDRLARGIVTPKLQPTDVGALVQRVVAESDLIADSRLRTDIASVTIPIDGAKIERIIENLLANTVRHTPATSIVWIGVREESDGALITVEDDGPGVAPDLTEAIFEPFRQGPDAPQHSPGVGVGLTLVKRFAELHGGRAWVEERDGGGASFRVFLPAESAIPVT